MRRIFLVPVLLVLLRGLPACGAESVSARLASAGRLGVSLAAAEDMEGKLGQLFIVNVDGFQYEGALAVHPAYVELAESLKVGGVIPHYGSASFAKIRDTNRELARRVPSLLIASDLVTLAGETPASTGRKTAKASFGDGYVGGFIGRYRSLPDDGFAGLAYLDAFVYRALGVNCAFGPTVDNSTEDGRTAQRAGALLSAYGRFGVQATLKHWPFIPAGTNLHRSSADTKVTAQELQGLTAVFRHLAPRADLMMSTHVFDSLVDPASLVTFSPSWLAMLRRDTGFRGLLVSDGLLMLRSYRALAAPPRPIPGLGSTEEDEYAGWVMRAILAGHDMVILEGTAWTTRKVFEKVLALACRSDGQAVELRERISASHARIMEFKRQHAAQINDSVDAPSDLVGEILETVSAVQDSSSAAAAMPDLDAFHRLKTEIDWVCRKLPFRARR